MDFIKELQHFFSSLGFRRIQVEGGLLWMKEAEGRLRLIEVIPELLPGQTRVPVSRQEERILHLENQLMIRFGEKTDRLTLMLFRGMPDEKTVEEIAPYPNIWCIDKSSGRLLIYENQRADFYGMKEQLENFLSACREGGTLCKPKRTSQNVSSGQYGPGRSKCAGICCAEYDGKCAGRGIYGAAWCHGMGCRGGTGRVLPAVYFDFPAFRSGTSGTEYVDPSADRSETGEDYRKPEVSRCISRLRYRRVGSVSFCYAGERAIYSIGGSVGAIFGVMGGLLFLILKDLLEKRRKRIDEIGLSGMLFVILSALSYGFTTTGVDNAAHVGGLVCGFLLTGILMIRK